MASTHDIVGLSYIFALGMIHPIISMLLSELDENELKKETLEAYRKFQEDLQYQEHLPEGFNDTLQLYAKDIENISTMEHERLRTSKDRQLLAMTFAVVRFTDRDHLDKMPIEELETTINSVFNMHLDAVAINDQGALDTNSFIEQLSLWAEDLTPNIIMN
jgi:hypothetical protein